MPRSIAGIILLGLIFTWCPSSHAQGVAFDIGVPESTYVWCPTDGVSWELYPPYPFGPFPAGSIVFASLEQADCSEITDLSSTCVGAFLASFDDGGCGCNGVLVEPTELELHYDAQALAEAGVAEASLRLYVYGRLGPGWVEVPDSRVDVEADAMRAQETGFIVGLRLYAIAGDPVTPVTPSTWSRVKALWR